MGVTNSEKRLLFTLLYIIIIMCNSCIVLKLLLLTISMGWCLSRLYYLCSLPSPQAAKLLWETV